MSLRYKSRTQQKRPNTVTAAGGTASWTWTVPRHVQPGVTHVTASCAGAGRSARTMTVIGGVLPPQIDVVQSGWSTRGYPFGGTGVSWGVILSNASKTQDAKDVQVLCNFVMSDNRLIGSMTVRVSDIAADSKHATGGELSFPSGAPIARLEIVVKIGSAAPATHTKPGISFIRVLPSSFEPAFAGAVSAALLLLLSPVIAFVLVAFALDAAFEGRDRGSLFYREPRISRGRTFGLLKFRTLRTDVLARAGGHARLLEADPANLTWLGRRILKPWYVDEVPQL